MTHFKLFSTASYQLRRCAILLAPFAGDMSTDSPIEPAGAEKEPEAAQSQSQPFTKLGTSRFARAPETWEIEEELEKGECGGDETHG